VKLKQRGGGVSEGSGISEGWGCIGEVELYWRNGAVSEECICNREVVLWVNQVVKNTTERKSGIKHWKFGIQREGKL